MAAIFTECACIGGHRYVNPLYIKTILLDDIHYGCCFTSCVELLRLQAVPLQACLTRPHDLTKSKGSCTNHMSGHSYKDFTSYVKSTHTNHMCRLMRVHTCTHVDLRKSTWQAGPSQILNREAPRNFWCFDCHNVCTNTRQNVLTVTRHNVLTNTCISVLTVTCHDVPTCVRAIQVIERHLST